MSRNTEYFVRFFESMLQVRKLWGRVLGPCTLQGTGNHWAAHHPCLREMTAVAAWRMDWIGALAEAGEPERKLLQLPPRGQVANTVLLKQGVRASTLTLGPAPTGVHKACLLVIWKFHNLEDLPGPSENCLKYTPVLLHPTGLLYESQYRTWQKSHVLLPPKEARGCLWLFGRPFFLFFSLAFSDWLTKTSRTRKWSLKNVFSFKFFRAFLHLCSKEYMKVGEWLPYAGPAGQISSASAEEGSTHCSPLRWPAICLRSCRGSSNKRK